MITAGRLVVESELYRTQNTKCMLAAGCYVSQAGSHRLQKNFAALGVIIQTVTQPLTGLNCIPGHDRGSF